jgi:hypothetical protein
LLFNILTKKQDVRKLIGFICLRIESSGELGNVPLGSIKGGQFQDQLRDYHLKESALVGAIG